MDFSRLSQQERFILGVLGAIICGLIFALVAATLLSGGGAPAQPVTPAVLLALPKPTKSTATPRPTRTPRPTNTLVVAREDYNRRLVQGIIDKVVVIRELVWGDEVPFSMVTRREMADVLRGLYSVEEIDADADRQWLLYKALGLVQEDVTFGDDAIEAWADQFAGLYIPEHDRIYIVTEVLSMNVEDEVVFAHEYTHALQDDYFELESYLAGIGSLDESLAARALVEGDATVVMAVYAYGNTYESQWDYLARKASLAEDPTLAIEGISERVSSIVLFPYQHGALFVVDLLLRGGWPAVDGAFSDPPLTTEQVLHPEKYLGDRDDAREISSPATPAEGWQLVLKDTLGKYVLSLHLDEFLDDLEQAAHAAAGWGGDRISMWQDGEGRLLTLWQTAWDTAGDAAEFEDAYSSIIPARFAGAARSDDTWWESADVAAGLLRDDRDVWIVWGADRSAAQSALDAAW